MYDSVDWGFACGRTYLQINGYAVAMEGDICRDVVLTSKFGPTWTAEGIKSVVKDSKKDYQKYMDEIIKGMKSEKT